MLLLQLNYVNLDVCKYGNYFPVQLVNCCLFLYIGLTISPTFFVRKQLISGFLAKSLQRLFFFNPLHKYIISIVCMFAYYLSTLISRFGQFIFLFEGLESTVIHMNEFVVLKFYMCVDFEWYYSNSLATNMFEHEYYPTLRQGNNLNMACINCPTCIC